MNVTAYGGKMKNFIGQHLIIGISGKELTTDEIKFLIHNQIGGIILFERNLESPEQISELCAKIQSLRHSTEEKIPFFIAIDMEGGRVHRLKEPFTQWPAIKQLGDLNSPTVAFNFANYMGKELRAVGINVNFSPCIDVLTNKSNTVIGDRSISDDHEKVSKLASALVRGFIKSDIIACAKHYPGHGNTTIDSHVDLPVENMDWAELEKIHLEPFKKAFRARMDMVMTAHIKYPKIDETWPATLSYELLHKIRSEHRYRGLILSDDLDMKALINHFSKEEIALQSILAGNDILLYCNEPDSPQIAIETLTKALEDKKINPDHFVESTKRIFNLKAKKLANPVPLNIRETIQIINDPQHKMLADSVRAGKIPEA